MPASAASSSASPSASSAASMRRASPVDALLAEVGRALQILSGAAQASRPNPAGPSGVQGMQAAQAQDAALDARQRRHAAGLMRVNHVGEVCAQALYRGQALGCRSTDPQAVAAAQVFHHAAAEEVDHLVWCQQRLFELGSRPSVLNPLWYAASFALGALASRAGVARNLGFMAETERQVGAHLAGHLAQPQPQPPFRQRQALPMADVRSRAIVAQMQADEDHHRHTAETHGGQALPVWVKGAMKAMSRVMTTTAYRI